MKLKLLTIVAMVIFTLAFYTLYVVDVRIAIAFGMFYVYNLIVSYVNRVYIMQARLRALDIYLQEQKEYERLEKLHELYPDSQVIERTSCKIDDDEERE